MSLACLGNSMKTHRPGALASGQRQWGYRGNGVTEVMGLQRPGLLQASNEARIGGC